MKYGDKDFVRQITKIRKAAEKHEASTPSGEDDECPECAGCGTLSDRNWNWDIINERECPVCDGTASRAEVDHEL